MKPSTHSKSQPARETAVALGLAGLLALAASCGSSDGGAAGEWRQWRGPGGLGISPAGALPSVWSGDSANVRWQARLPERGNSSPIVTGGKVFLTSATNEGDSTLRSLLALDLETGELLWSKVVAESPQRSKRHPLNSDTASTPITDGRFVYVQLGGELLALDLDGEVVWRREVDPLYDEHVRYGSASSLVLADGKLLLALDREHVRKPTGWIAAFAAGDGEEVWRVEWGDDCCSYSTPLVLDRGAGSEAVFFRGTQIVSYDPDTGEELWSHPLQRVQPTPSLVYENGLLAVVGGVHHSRTATVLRLTGAGRETRVEPLWEDRRLAAETSSPILLDGLLYQAMTGSTLSCRDAETGEVVWKKRLPTGSYHASLLAGDGKLYAASREGVTTVVKLGRELELLGENDLGAGSTASPATAGGCLLLRAGRAVFCIEKEAAAAS